MPPLKKVKTDKTASKDAKDALYARCLLEDPNKRFTTNDLLDLGVIRRNDRDLLIECTQTLLKEGLFQASDSAQGATFRVVKKEDAARYEQLANLWYKRSRPSTDGFHCRVGFRTSRRMRTLSTRRSRPQDWMEYGFGMSISARIYIRRWFYVALRALKIKDSSRVSRASNSQLVKCTC